MLPDAERIADFHHQVIAHVGHTEYYATASQAQYHFCRRQKYHAEQHEAYHLIHFIPHSAVNIIL